MDKKTRYKQKTPQMLLRVTKVVLETNQGPLELEVEDGFFVHEDSDVFPYQVKVKNGTITEHGQK